NHMSWEEPGKKPSRSHSQKAFHTNMVTQILPSVSIEDVPGAVPLQPRCVLPHSHTSLDDLWLEMTQRRRLEKQAQIARKMSPGIAHKDGVQCWRKMTITSPESLTLLKRNGPFSQSAPTGLNGMGCPDHSSDP
ncbi:Rho guanine nucleotide exchange factor 4, partial [Galemys pyrenaicus]